MLLEGSASKLIELSNSIKEEKGITPSILCVICGLSNAAYKRKDGVYVIPITALKN